jgi:hypothetical protein
MSPASAPVDEHDLDLREPKDTLTGKPEAPDVPAEEGVEEVDVDAALEEGSESARNRRDVPPTPENTVEARTEDGAEDEITEP